MRRVGLAPKRGQKSAEILIRELAAWLAGRGVDASVEAGFQAEVPLDLPILTDPDFSGQDLIIVLGGDGTLLRAARKVDRGPVPLLGVNLGGLGFLTEVTAEELFQALELILSGRHRPEERMRLSGRVVRQGEVVSQCLVLNDLVVNKGAPSRIINLSASLNGRHLTDYRADGLIVSTPTGSTAYNLSAGGPILDPTTTAMVLTPICPFTLANRPLVVHPETELTIRLGGQAEDVHLTGDGQVDFPLRPGDEVIVSRGRDLRLFPSPFQDHYAILRTKLGWGSQAVRPAAGAG